MRKLILTLLYFLTVCVVANAQHPSQYSNSQVQGIYYDNLAEELVPEIIDSIYYREQGTLKEYSSIDCIDHTCRGHCLYIRTKEAGKDFLTLNVAVMNCASQMNRSLDSLKVSYILDYSPLDQNNVLEFIRLKKGSVRQIEIEKEDSSGSIAVYVTTGVYASRNLGLYERYDYKVASVYIDNLAQVLVPEVIYSYYRKHRGLNLYKGSYISCIDHILKQRSFKFTTKEAGNVFLTINAAVMDCASRMNRSLDSLKVSYVLNDSPLDHNNARRFIRLKESDVRQVKMEKDDSSGLITVYIITKR